MNNLEKVLPEHAEFAAVIRNAKPYRRLDFSAGNLDLLERDFSETAVFSNYIFEEMLSENTFIGIGGYDENRVIYRHRKHFTAEEEKPRSIHLGTDIWAEAGEAIYAPLDGIVHSFAFNDHYGDYGPTIILSHELQGLKFFTLYGHLSLVSLDGLYEGKSISAGEKFASIGSYPENGDWPPHLHFQIIGDIGAYSGDFPGVSSIQDREHYLSICPDPNLILRINENGVI
ncbi:peptidoglycan DD-metalloendopeptidase family protein [Dyadobacter pollutisoli]|jgi:murein DD-endopeptidase MepM/ murein hydrolase activator NlpD|uniref:Peptidoglycan DD-metalloendopeptidase family protein n=1 Tax=Dyadobacter pollutisoli TaxID=2910158 RepID=A0A9E8SJR4_9BACT|nr:peptidoglycan DD-metalloendopeptidase family protein [Dyadobacter pollutisoli]WAC11133.1 peptidoglycan DD-metalloendopeptidase family protein [Dyadobacter pollutisoli]